MFFRCVYAMNTMLFIFCFGGTFFSSLRSPYRGRTWGRIWGNRSSPLPLSLPLRDVLTCFVALRCSSPPPPIPPPGYCCSACLGRI